MQKKDQRRYKYIVPGTNKSYFVEDHTDSNRNFSETDIIKMLWLMGGVVFEQTAVIPVGPNCVPLHDTWVFCVCLFVVFFCQTFIKYKDDGVPQVILYVNRFLSC